MLCCPQAYYYYTNAVYYKNKVAPRVTFLALSESIRSLSMLLLPLLPHPLLLSAISLKHCVEPWFSRTSLCPTCRCDVRPLLDRTPLNNAAGSGRQHGRVVRAPRIPGLAAARAAAERRRKASNSPRFAGPIGNARVRVKQRDIRFR